jgi:hypothetical protein
MPSIDPQAFALGFFAVIGLGLLTIYAGIHLRRVHTAQRITARYVAWNKVHAAHLDAQLADVPPRTGEVHVCNVNGNCAQGRRAGR